jgi:hypothetical protein
MKADRASIAVTSQTSAGLTRFSIVRSPATVSRRRPVIGVTGPDSGGEAAWIFTWLALALSGASARHITPHET